MSHLRLKDGRLNRTIPLDAAVGTIEIDVSGEGHTIVVPAEASVTVERR